MPSDILGTELLEKTTAPPSPFPLPAGPDLHPPAAGDELNRTPPKTQAALLEAMQERAVSYAGTTYALPAPFFVLATQNPIEQAGTRCRKRSWTASCCTCWWITPAKAADLGTDRPPAAPPTRCRR
jgi:hypothetical protein